MDLGRHVRDTILTRRLLRPGDLVVVAVSGGRDSMVLLDLLHRLAGEQGWRLWVAHLNHQLRGAESEADQEFVRAVAAALGVGFTTESVAVGPCARATKTSVEMAARRLRHEFLARVVLQTGAACVALAHHADDQTETVLLRLLRGAGGEGLGGMRWTHRSPANPKVRLIRPLLDQPRASLAAYVQEKRLEFREDQSNAQTDLLRNRVRHELLPWLRQRFQPGIDATIWRAAEIVGAEAEVVGALAERWLRRRHRRAFARLPVAVQRRVVGQQLLALKIEPTFELIEGLRESSGVVLMPLPGQQVWREESGVVVSAPVMPLTFKDQTLELDLTGPVGTCEFEGLAIRWRTEAIKPDQPVPRRSTPGCESFDADNVGPRVCLRHWRPGDRFQPSGLAQASKLQNLLTNKRIPAESRRRLVVGVTREGELFWVEGLRIAERFKLDPTSQRRLTWVWERLQRPD